jgi:T5SS/PEP-CTERM-associated repeat protein
MKSRLVFLAASVLALAVSPLHAQVVADGVTATVINVTNTITGDVTVGTNGAFTLLVLSDNALLTNSLNGIIGRNASAKSNEVRLISASARWLMGGTLFVGSNGSFSRLVVSNGAFVRGNLGQIGFNPSSSNNLALVTGPGSVWSNRDDIVVGGSGNGNRLEVSDGARVESVSGTLGEFVSASNNVAVVTGPGSFWRMEEDGDLAVGNGGGGNRLVITNGAWVRGGGVIGRNPSSTNNEVVVTGPGSSWTNLNGLLVGFVGSRNRLVITNGGEVVSDRGVTLGLAPGATNNRVVVDGGALRALDPVEGILDVRRGTNVLNAGLIDVQQLRLTNAQGFFEFNGGTLITRGAFINNKPFNEPFNVGNSGGPPAVWDIRAGASDHFVESTLQVGADSSFNQLILTNGALLTNSGYASLGSSSVARSNSAALAGAGSRWRLDDIVIVGGFGSGNRLVVSNGASLVTGGSSSIGDQFVSTNNEAVVTGPGSSWTSSLGTMVVGNGARDNRLLVSDRGLVVSFAGILGERFANSTNNLAVVTGAGSLWSNATTLRVGNVGAANRLVVSNGATVFAGSAVYAGFDPTSTNNRLTVDGGTLRTTNASATGVLDVRRGTNVLNAGLIEVDRLLLTNTLGIFEFNGGTLSARNSAVNNGQLFRVGNGVSPATFALTGNGAHAFANGLTVSANALLTGNGAINGILSVQTSGTLAPGASVGKIVLSNSPSLQGAVVMEISKNGAARTNDVVQVVGALTYGGSLVVSNLGPSALAAGDRFQLFTASSFAGSFSSITLPPLAFGLAFTNKLLADGSIEVVLVAVSQPKFSTISVSGTNVILSGTNGTAGQNYAMLTTTNVATPSSNWVSLVTNQFDSNGNFSFTNGIIASERQRYFRIRTP